jgi:hypothetical protein
MEKHQILAAAKKFLIKVFGNESSIPDWYLSGPVLGIGIAQELGTRLSTGPILENRYVRKEEKLAEFFQSSKVRYGVLEGLPQRYDLNCGQIGMLVDKTFSYMNIAYTRDFIEFLKTGTIRFSKLGRISLQEVLEVLEELETSGLFIDRIQKEAVKLLLPMAKEGGRRSILNFDGFRVIPPKKKGDNSHIFIERLVFIVAKILSASKTQKRNISNLSDRRGIVSSRMFNILSYILPVREEVSRTVLQSLRRLILDPRRGGVLSTSARKAEERRIPFQSWTEIVIFAKRHEDRAVFNLLEENFSSLEEFKFLVEEKIASKRNISWKQSFPEIKSEEFVIQEITNGFDLYEEGKQQGHCAAEYEESCLAGRNIILSVRGKGKRRYTIQLMKNELGQFELNQFRGRFNRKPLEEDYWRVLLIIEEHCPENLNLVLPTPGTEMVW